MTTSVSPTTEPTATMASAGSLKGKDMTIIGGDYDGFVQAVDLVAEGEGNIVPYTSSPRDGYYIVIPVRGFGGDLPVRAVDSAAANPRLNRAIRLHLLRLTRDDLLVNPPLPITILSLDALEHIVRHRQWITCRFTGIDIDLFTAYPVIRPSSNARDSARQHHALPDARHIHEAASFSEDIQRRINIALARRRDEANVKFSTRTPRAAGTAKKRSRPNVELDRAGNEPPPEQTTGKRYIASTIRVRRRPYPIDSSLTAEEAPNVETEGMASPEPEPKRFKVIPYEPAPLLPVEEIRQTYTFLDLDSSQVFVVGALVVFAYLFGKDAGTADCRAACSQINLSSALTALRGATEAAARYSGGAL